MMVKNRTSEHGSGLNDSNFQWNSEFCRILTGIPNLERELDDLFCAATSLVGPFFMPTLLGVKINKGSFFFVWY